MSWLADWRLKHVARRYAQRLPARLSANWGSSKTYTKGQIDTAILEARLDPNSSYVAYAIYLPPEELAALQHHFSRHSIHAVQAAFERERPRSAGSQSGDYYESGLAP
ncbi:DUF6559 family protein [Phenylobacterium sp.]|jgi:hypothetical protein|uniref:DUF6559 family protein n=1 Tax=Phenylobacterium sp. TaxID=1871053 RepID=UPI0037C7AF68